MASENINEGTIISELRTIRTFGKYRNPDPDRVLLTHLQEDEESLIRSPNIVFTSCPALGYVPRMWLEKKVAFSPVPGKDRYNRAERFNPITFSLLSLKALKIPIDRIIGDKVLTDRQISSSRVYTYQPCKSVETALRCLLREIKGVVSRDETLLGVFIGIELRPIGPPSVTTAEAAGNFELGGTITRLILDMLRQQLVMASVVEAIIRVPVGKGCPKGWSIIHPIVDHCRKRFTVGLADRGCIIQQGYADN